MRARGRAKVPPRFGTVQPHAFFGARFSSGSCVASLCTTAACGDWGAHSLVGLGKYPEGILARC